MNKDNHNDFENKGWETMLQTLDREMPVEKKRRRFLWLVFFIGLSTLLVGGFWYLNTKNPIKELDKTISKPIVDISSPKNTERDRIIDLNENNKIKNNKAIGNNNSNSSLIENNKLIDNRDEIKSIELLNKIKIAPLSIEQDTNLKIEPKPIYVIIRCLANVPKKLRMGITTGIHTEKGQKIDGFQAGFVINQTLNHRWSINTGLNFRQTQTIGDSISYFRKEYLASATSSSNLQSGTPISLDKLYYLELPLTIEYHFKKKFAFSTGLKTSYLVGQSVKENGNSVYFVKSSFTPQNSYDLLNKVNTKTLGLNRWDISLMGGFSYLPTKHVQLGLRYDLGFKNIINRTNWTAYNRYIGLNATYLF